MICVLAEDLIFLFELRYTICHLSDLLSTFVPPVFSCYQVLQCALTDGFDLARYNREFFKPPDRHTQMSLASGASLSVASLKLINWIT